MGKTRFFGTDGIRGRVGKPPITADFILRLGWAIGNAVKQSKKKPTILIGKDTRISGYLLESALEAGLSAAGANVLLVGPMPTPAVAYLTQTLRADLGIVISASHNSFYDNGIKLFSARGLKINLEMELLIESYLEQSPMTLEAPLLGKASRVDDASGRYIEFCKSAIPHNTRFSSFKLVIDCANGATYKVAPHVFRELGAEVITLNRSPNGLNINLDCGSLSPEGLREIVLKENATAGIALDGDGDRLLIIDDKGEYLNGDEILFIILKGLIEAKRFSGGIVGTWMTNSGFENKLHEMKIPFERVNVGDHFVIERLLQNKWLLGGEPSGHIIYLPTLASADGIITALQALFSSMQLSQSIHEIKQGLHKIPHKLINFQVQDEQKQKLPLEEWTDYCHKIIGNKGRILIRPSGTEPIIRLLIEYDDSEKIEEISEQLSQYLLNQIEKLSK